MLTSQNSPSETVRKGLLRGWLGKVPSTRRAYQADPSDAEWSHVEPYLPAPKASGRPRLHTLREILDALRERLRVRLKRDPQPSADEVDSQSVKGTGVGGDQRGYDGGKKVKGRKRHLLVETEGFVLKVKVHSAKVMDYEGIKTLLEGANQAFPRLCHLWVDALPKGYPQGDGARSLRVAHFRAMRPSWPRSESRVWARRELASLRADGWGDTYPFRSQLAKVEL
jgi:hypothetical protein